MTNEADDPAPVQGSAEYERDKLRGALLLAGRSRDLWKARAEAAGWTRAHGNPAPDPPTLKVVKDGDEPGVRDAVVWLERHGLKRSRITTVHVKAKVGEPMRLTFTIMVNPDELEPET